MLTVCTPDYRDPWGTSAYVPGLPMLPGGTYGDAEKRESMSSTLAPPVDFTVGAQQRSENRPSLNREPTVRGWEAIQEYPTFPFICHMGLTVWGTQRILQAPPPPINEHTSLFRFPAHLPFPSSAHLLTETQRMFRKAADARFLTSASLRGSVLVTSSTSSRPAPWRTIFAVLTCIVGVK